MIGEQMKQMQWHGFGNFEYYWCCSARAHHHHHLSSIRKIYLLTENVRELVKDAGAGGDLFRENCSILLTICSFIPFTGKKVVVLIFCSLISKADSISKLVDSLVYQCVRWWSSWWWLHIEWAHPRHCQLTLIAARQSERHILIAYQIMNVRFKWK